MPCMGFLIAQIIQQSLINLKQFIVNKMLEFKILHDTSTMKISFML
jgi:hypothetical protein